MSGTIFITASAMLIFSYSKVTELQQEHSDYLAQKKAEALDAVALMEDYVMRKVEQERSSDRERGYCRSEVLNWQRQ
jgi:hypothetical protein